MNDKGERCLCSNCKADYETAGYKVKRIYEIEEKDHCDKCKRLGWYYHITEKKNGLNVSF